MEDEVTVAVIEYSFVATDMRNIIRMILSPMRTTVPYMASATFGSVVLPFVLNNLAGVAVAKNVAVTPFGRASNLFAIFSTVLSFSLNAIEYALFAVDC